MIPVRGSPPTKQRIGVSCECGGSSLLRDNEAGELVCRGCGLVASDTLVDLGPEWSAFTQDEDKKRSRAGAPISWAFYDKGLSTVIGWQSRDAAGRKMGAEAQARLFRLRRWHQRSRASGSLERNLAQAFGEMRRIGDLLSLPRSVLGTAAVNYRKAAHQGLVRGRTIKGLVVACVYMACRQCGVVMTLEDVGGAAGVSRKEAAGVYRFLLGRLEPSVPQVDPEGYISRIVNKLALSGETEKLAKVVLGQASEGKLTAGRSPQGLAAACVYVSCLLCGERRTQAEIAVEAQVTEVTIRNRYKELVNLLEYNIHL